MKTFTKTLVVATAICMVLACSKTETTPLTPAATKCTNSTILDALLSGKQMYLLTTVAKTQVLLNLKDKKGKARAFGVGVNPVLYEWDIQISAVSETQVKLQAGDIIAIRGIFVAGIYLPDSFFFKDNNCKITGETSDGQTVYNNPIIYEDVTNSKDLAAILDKYLW
ncbi:hypothetical protein [Runella rosea]|nr:hypothetical protein [Runella rosea]